MTSNKSALGFANLPNQVHRKSVKKGFEFTIMVVGESGLGKSTLMNCLFGNQLKDDKNTKEKENKNELNDLMNKQVEIKTSTFDIEEGGVKLHLTVVNTPGYGEALDCTDSIKPIINYIDEQYERYLHYENGLNRKQINDNRIHCCFYFLSPISYSLKPIDIYFMKSLHDKVNIIPIIGRADALTVSEIKQLKKSILDDIKKNNINIYLPTDCDDDDDDYKNVIKEIKSSIPFAISSSIELHDKTGGKQIKGRLYPWGLVETENGAHSDFVKLRSLLVSNMQDLREITQDIHYENYRAARLISKTENTHNKLDNLVNHDLKDDFDKEKILMEKDAELKRMQEMLELMKEQMKSQQIASESSSLNGTITSNDE